MDPKAILLILGIVLVFVIISTFIPNAPITIPQDLSYSLEAGSDSITIGTHVDAKAKTSGADVKTITLEFGGEKVIQECNSRNCLFEKTFIPKTPGAYTLKMTIALSNGSVEKSSKRINVFDSQKRCTGSIAFNQCSSQKPLYCENGSFVGKCSICGCNDGYYCSNETCLPEAKKVEITSLKYAEKVLAGKEFSIIIEVTSEAGFVSGAKYKTKISLDNDIAENEFVISEVGNTQSWAINKLSLPAGTHSILIEVFSINETENLAATYSKENAIESLVSAPPIGIPQIQSIFAEGDDAVITWSGVSNSSGYKLYKSTVSKEIYTAYRLYSSFDANTTTTVIQGLSSGTHAFVIRAVDLFGNDGDYSEPKTVVIG